MLEYADFYVRILIWKIYSIIRKGRVCQKKEKDRERGNQSASSESIHQRDFRTHCLFFFWGFEPFITCIELHIWFSHTFHFLSLLSSAAPVVTFLFHFYRWAIPKYKCHIDECINTVILIVFNELELYMNHHECDVFVTILFTWHSALLKFK